MGVCNCKACLRQPSSIALLPQYSGPQLALLQRHLLQRVGPTIAALLADMEEEVSRGAVGRVHSINFLI